MEVFIDNIFLAGIVCAMFPLLGWVMVVAVQYRYHTLAFVHSENTAHEVVEIKVGGWEKVK